MALVHTLSKSTSNVVINLIVSTNLNVNQRYLLTVELRDCDQDGNGIDAKSGRIRELRKRTKQT